MTGYLKTAVATCLALALNQSLFAQQTFDSKKHQRTHVNAAPLRAKVIAPPSKSSAGRSVLNKRYLTQQPSWTPPQLQKGRMKIEYSRATGLPALIRSSRNAANGRSGQQRDARVATYSYLEELKHELKIENPER